MSGFTNVIVVYSYNMMRIILSREELPKALLVYTKDHLGT
jgi:hypothetical protein